MIDALKAHKKMSNALSRDIANRTKKRDIHFGVTMLVLNFLFFVLNFPFKLLQFDPKKFNNLFNGNFFAYFLYVHITDDLFYLYYSIIFYVQVMVNNLGRVEVFRVFRRVFRHIGVFKRTANFSSTS